MVATILAAIIYWPVGIVIAVAYVVSVVLRSIKTRVNVSLPQMIGFYLLSDFLNLVYFFTFYPKDLKEEYVVVKAQSLKLKV